MNAGDNCDPLGVGTVSLELPVEWILILVDLLTHLHLLPGSADFSITKPLWSLFSYIG